MSLLKKSFTIGNHRTSISLEPEFWDVLEIKAKEQNVSLSKLVLKIDHEKPKDYISSLAVVGLYIYEKTCFEYIKELIPSARGELEITDLNKIYMNKKLLNYKLINSWWIDAGTEDRISELKGLI